MTKKLNYVILVQIVSLPHVKIEYIYKDIYLKIIKEYLGLRAKPDDNHASKKTNDAIQKAI